MISQTETLFPLQGPEASIALGLEFVIIFVMIQFFLHFLVQYIQSVDKSRGGRNLAWAILFLGFAGAYMVYIYTDHVVTDMVERDRMAIYAYLSLSIGGAFTLILSEKSRTIETSRVFTILVSIMLGIIILGWVLDQRDLARNTAFIGAPLAFAYIVLYLRLLLRMSNYARQVIIPVSEFFIGGLAIIIGYTLNSDFILELMGIRGRIIGDLIVIVGLNLFMYGLGNLPDFGEFDWKQKIRALLIINCRDGVCLFSRFFQETNDENSSRDTLIAGAWSVQTVLKELSGKDAVESVQLSDKALIFDSHKQFISVIIADNLLRSLQFRLQQFSQEFESIFQEILQNWDGNVNIFLPADVIADKIFMPNQIK